MCICTFVQCIHAGSLQGFKNMVVMYLKGCEKSNLDKGAANLVADVVIHKEKNRSQNRKKE